MGVRDGSVVMAVMRMGGPASVAAEPVTKRGQAHSTVSRGTTAASIGRMRMGSSVCGLEAGTTGVAGSNPHTQPAAAFGQDGPTVFSPRLPGVLHADATGVDVEGALAHLARHGWARLGRAVDDDGLCALRER